MTNNRIVVVDDDRRLVGALSDYLGEQGYEVSSVHNGLAAQTAVVSKKPALVILDIDLPIMSGLQVLEQLRRDPSTHQIPVIIMTGVPSSRVYPMIQDETRLSHLKKPVEPIDLLSIVKHYVPTAS